MAWQVTLKTLILTVSLIAAQSLAAQAQPAPQVMIRPAMNPQAIKAAADAQKSADEAVEHICTDVTDLDIGKAGTTFHCLANGKLQAIWTVSHYEELGAGGPARETLVVQSVVAFMAAKAANPGSPMKLRVTGKDGFLPTARRIRLIR